MLITIHSDHRDADDAYTLERYLKNGLGFTVLESDFTIAKLYCYDVDQDDIDQIMVVIAEYCVSCEIGFKTILKV